MNSRKSIVISAPSGAGKSTIVKALLAQNPSLAFSISACSRPPRGEEQDAVHYYFLSPDSFKEKIAAGAFFEWEEVYTGMFYGTLNEELERIWAAGQIVVFDVDVVPVVSNFPFEMVCKLLNCRCCVVIRGVVAHHDLDVIALSEDVLRDDALQ
jgi:guanylate kinase